MATRRLTITVEGDGQGADLALLRLVEALRLAVAPVAPEQSDSKPARPEGSA
jgi:hypothetical protein